MKTNLGYLHKLHRAQSCCLALYCEVIFPRSQLSLYPLDKSHHLLVLAAQKIKVMIVVISADYDEDNANNPDDTI
jgi:hypothetical protein